MTAPSEQKMREAAAQALAQGATVRQAAESSGYHLSSLYRVRKTPEFQALVARYREELGLPDPEATAETDRLKALETLRTIMEDAEVVAGAQGSGQRAAPRPPGAGPRGAGSATSRRPALPPRLLF